MEPNKAKKLEKEFNFDDPIYRRIYYSDYTTSINEAYAVEREKNIYFLKEIVRNVYIKDTWLTYRTINHWTEVWLLDDDREDKKTWRKFNVMELVWIEILNKLRWFWVSIKSMQVIKNYIFPIESDSETLHRIQLFEFFIMSSIIHHSKNIVLVFDDWVAWIISELDFNSSKNLF